MCIHPWVKCGAKVRAARYGVGNSNTGMRISNEGVLILKHYEIILINARYG